MINLAATLFLSLSAWLLNLDTIYVLTGSVLLVFAVMTFKDLANTRRYSSGLFWLLLAFAFAFGSWLPHWLTGLLVLAMVAIDGLGRVGRGDYREATREQQAEQAARLKNRIFW